VHDNQDDWLHGWRSHARKWGNLLGNLGKLKRPYQQNWPAQKATDVAIVVRRRHVGRLVAMALERVIVIPAMAVVNEIVAGRCCAGMNWPSFRVCMHVDVR
jgi:hypothetical protein